MRERDCIKVQRNDQGRNIAYYKQTKERVTAGHFAIEAEVCKLQDRTELNPLMFGSKAKQLT